MFSKSFLASIRSHDVLTDMAQEYALAEPFPHIVIEDAFDTEALHAAHAGFPEPDPSWWKYDNALERKFAKDRLDDESPAIQSLVAAMQSRLFTDFLEDITGIDGLIVDQGLRGGGLHQIARGGKLDIHADYNVHPVTKLDRRLNVILYLNRDWQTEWGGELQLWSGDSNGLHECKRAIMPWFGRMVIFSTTDTSYHGHPDPLMCREGVTRKSIALYYYTNGRPHHEQSPPHSTLYMRRPSDPTDPEIENLRIKRSKGRLT